MGIRLAYPIITRLTETLVAADPRGGIGFRVLRGVRGVGMMYTHEYQSIPRRPPPRRVSINLINSYKSAGFIPATGFRGNSTLVAGIPRETWRGWIP